MQLFEKITGFRIDQKEMIKILTNLGFEIKKQKKLLLLTVPTWRPDILQEVDIVEVDVSEEEPGITVLPSKTRAKLGLNREFTLERKPRAEIARLLGLSNIKRDRYEELLMELENERDKLDQ